MLPVSTVSSSSFLSCYSIPPLAAHAAARKLITEFLHPGIIYPDIKRRKLEDTPGDLDVYTAGFPCQSFSRAGLN